MPKKSRNKMKEWRRLSSGNHQGRKEKRNRYEIPPILHGLVYNLMGKLDDVKLTLSKYSSKVKGELNEVI